MVSSTDLTTARALCCHFGFKPLTEDKGRKHRTRPFWAAAESAWASHPWACSRKTSFLQSGSAPAKARAGPTWQRPPAWSCRYRTAEHQLETLEHTDFCKSGTTVTLIFSHPWAAVLTRGVSMGVHPRKTELSCSRVRTSSLRSWCLFREAGTTSCVSPLLCLCSIGVTKATHIHMHPGLHTLTQA